MFRIVQLPDGNRGAALSFFQHNPLVVIWFFFGLFWMLPGIFGKRTIQKQTSRSRFLQLALLVGSYVLMAVPDLGWGLLNQPVVPTGRTASAVGYSLLLAGMSFAGWARIFLGGNWSSDVTLKQDHTLVRSGPYRIVRHPIYTGLLFGLLGSAIALGEFEQAPGERAGDPRQDRRTVDRGAGVSADDNAQHVDRGARRQLHL